MFVNVSATRDTRRSWPIPTPPSSWNARSSATTPRGTRTTCRRSSPSTRRTWCSRITRPASGSRETPSQTHLEQIFRNWPDLTFHGRRAYVRDGLVVNEWTATATDDQGRRLEWDGVDIFPFEEGLILRKDVYSTSHRPRVVDPLDA